MPDQSDAWVGKAEGAVRTALRELAVQEQPDWDGVCFHAQQAVEKYLKALLTSSGATPFRRLTTCAFCSTWPRGTSPGGWRTVRS
jgi:HEPN domain-containing protein